MSPTLDSMLTGSNATYIAELYARYLGNPNAVDPSWVSFFKDLKDDGRAVLDELRGASWRPSDARVVDSARPEIGGISDEEVRSRTLDSIRALMMIRNYRVRGHLIAKFDPLGIEGQENHPELDYRTYGFTEADMERPIFIDNVLGLESASLREILSVLKETYAAPSASISHIQEPRKDRAAPDRAGTTARIHLKASGPSINGWSRPRATNLPAQKVHRDQAVRPDGGESLIPAMEPILKRGGQLGVKEVVLGMPHRGRLNVLANIMRKPHVAILSEFQGNASTPDDVEGSGDVKYHLGTSADRDFDGNVIHLSLTANPSHLEAVNPVVLGKVRANFPTDTRNAIKSGLLLHGDAAFAGRGLVPKAWNCRSFAVDRRHDPYRREQPDRFHHAPGEVAVVPVLFGYRQGTANSGLPRKRRRTGSRGPHRPDRGGVPPGIQEGRGHRHVLLSPAWTQRRRRAHVYQSDHVQGH